MMQTFLPYPSFRDSARCLDVKRLGKQRVECKQILLALGVPVGEHQPKRSSWVNHPAARMWQGHEAILCEYAIAVCDEWIRRGYRDTLRPQFVVAHSSLLANSRWHSSPNWIGYDAFHASHRSNLLRKDCKHYGQFGWRETADLPYFWPTHEEVMA
jgi:hypothetical protein